MPVLDSIRKRGLVDCVVVVTRYFGGTLLGTGGLVRAYSAASSGAITSAQIITYDIYCEIKISCDYSDYGKITPIFDELSFRVTDTEYAEGITVIGKIEKAKADELKLKLTETTSARSGYEILGEKYDF
jgi:putative IMPACT (imprinted ancient) family translation regulator